jgi:hypothetical protein
MHFAPLAVVVVSLSRLRWAPVSSPFSFVVPLAAGTCLGPDLAGVPHLVGKCCGEEAKAARNRWTGHREVAGEEVPVVPAEV